MASRFSIGFSLFILAYCVTCSSAAVASWQEEFEMKMEAKMNKIETKNVQLEGKVTELEAQLEGKVTELEAQLELNVRTFHFLLSFLVQ
jgi:outer membrane murein-binding lipoprotein Lpp